LDPKGKINFGIDKVASYDLPEKEGTGRNVRLLAYEKGTKTFGSKI